MTETVVETTSLEVVDTVPIGVTGSVAWKRVVVAGFVVSKSCMGLASTMELAAGTVRTAATCLVGTVEAGATSLLETSQEVQPLHVK